ncbi:hypothetical protein PV325_002437 [Microctonus aethiopoides]|nr:hypothetical protein PV325_002437 [Microctonus aethiopoides]
MRLGTPKNNAQDFLLTGLVQGNSNSTATIGISETIRVREWLNWGQVAKMPLSYFFQECVVRDQVASAWGSWVTDDRGSEQFS